MSEKFPHLFEIQPRRGGKSSEIEKFRAEQPPEAEADADTAFELGRVAGYDEAMREMWRVRGGVDLLIHDLMGTREDGSVLTTGYLIYRLKEILADCNVEPRREPSDAQVRAAVKAWGEHRWLNVPATNMTSMRAALLAAANTPS